MRPTRALVHQELRVTEREERSAWPLGHGIDADEVSVERRDCVDVVGEEGDLGETAHVAISNSLRTSFNDVLRSVDALRVPTMSAHGRS